MRSTVLALEAHDNEISEVRHAGLAHTHLPHHLAGVTRNLEDNRLFHHEIALLERFSEVEFGAEFFSLDGLALGLCVLGTVAHCD